MSRNQLDRRWEALRREGYEVLSKFRALSSRSPGALASSGTPLIVGADWFALGSKASNP